MTHDDTTRADRRRRGTLLCERLTRDVEKIAPDGIGHWGPAWKIAGPADAAFMIALTKWEATGDDEYKPPLRTAYFAVLDAWRYAATEYAEREGVER